MKVRNSLPLAQKRDKNSASCRRRGRTYVINKKNRRVSSSPGLNLHISDVLGVKARLVLGWCHAFFAAFLIALMLPLAASAAPPQPSRRPVHAAP